jgi:uncharacterized membrane protein YgaE (UPF0421/DUF939 family)
MMKVMLLLFVVIGGGVAFSVVLLWMSSKMQIRNIRK